MLNALLETTSVSVISPSNGTIYTVPSGRTAIIITSARKNINDGSFIVDGRTYFLTSGQFETHTFVTSGSVQVNFLRNVSLRIFLLPSDIF